MIDHQFHIAIEQTRREDWQDHISPPKKASNWGEDTFLAKLDKLWEAKEEAANTDIAASYVSQVAVSYTAPGSPTAAVTKIADAKDATKYIVETLEEVLSLEGVIEGKSTVGFIGINPLQQLRAIGWTLAMTKTEVTPAWLWAPERNNPAIQLLNLRSIAGKESKTENENIQRWFQSWGIPYGSELGMNFAAIVKASQVMGWSR